MYLSNKKALCLWNETFLVNTLHCISGQNRTDTIQVENTSSGLNHEVNIFFQHKIVVSLNYRCVSRICKNLGVLDRRGGLQSSSKSHFTLTGAFTCSALCSAAYFSGDSQWEQILKIRQNFFKIRQIYWSCLCLQLFGNFWIRSIWNDRKRK